MSPCLDGRYRSTQSAAISDTGTFATTSFRNNSSSSGVQRTFLFFDTRRSLISPSPSARARPGGGGFGGATEAAIVLHAASRCSWRSTVLPCHYRLTTRTLLSAVTVHRLNVGASVDICSTPGCTPIFV